MNPLESRLAGCMLLDQHALRRRMQRLRASRQGDPRWARLEQDVARCEARLATRRARVPEASPLSGLPIANHAAEITAAIAEHPVVVVSGDTGSGKSTQLPKLCLAAGRGRYGQIAHTQPRRMAARSVARRIAHELGEPLGSSVGYKVRFDAEVRRESFIKVVTDGLLLAELAKDRDLLAYDTVIVDEAHERSLNIDFLLGHLKRLIARRRELRVVVSSATLDEQRFCEFFDGAPLVRVEGRRYPVEVRYRPGNDGEELALGTERAVRELMAHGDGDILVFLSGEREISDVAGRLRAALGKQCDVLPLYARLPLAQQDRVFEPHSKRRVILSTNVAETSLTVPGVRFVVDAGQVRVARHSPGSAVQRLPVEPISKASARQRAGRCGREAPGVCIRLYAESDYDGFRDYSEPEITRTDLAAVLLRIRALGVRRIASFPLLDAPERRHVNDGLRLLRELGAFDARDRLSALGRQLARFPLDPRIGRMLVAANALGCLREVLVIAAALSVGDARERRAGERGLAPQHLRFEDERSDFVTYLNIWQHLQARAPRRSVRALKELCQRRRLSFRRVQEWREVHLQLTLLARDLRLHITRDAASYARIHRALLAGLVRNVGTRSEGRDYQGIRGNVFRVAKRSSQSDRNPRWVMAAQIVDAGRAVAHTVARIRPEWVEEAAGDLLRRSHFEGYWDPRRGEPMVHEQTALYALTVTPKRKVRFAPVSRSGAREVFINGALLDGRFSSSAPFIAANRELLRSRRQIQQRLRRPDPDLSDERLFRFFDARLPHSVCDAASFDSWWRQADASELAGFDLSMHLSRCQADATALTEIYPSEVHASEATLPLRYRFAPGADDDGVTVVVPRRGLGALDERVFEWLVPGLTEEKVIALLRALPKTMRKRLGSIADTARAFVADHPQPSGSLHVALAHFLRLRYGIDVSRELWSPQRLEQRLAPHLLMRFEVVDDDGAVFKETRRPDEISGAAAARRDDTAPGPPPQPRLRKWPRELVVAEQETHSNRGATITLYCALYDHGNGVSIEKVHARPHAEALHRQGVLWLARNDPRIRSLASLRRVPDAEHLVLLHGLLAPPPELALLAPSTGSVLERVSRLDVRDAVVDTALLGSCFAAGTWEIRDRDRFEHAMADGHEPFERALERALAEALSLHEAARSLRARLASQDWPRAWQPSLEDIREQLDWLVFHGFLNAHSPDVIGQLGRYLSAVETRLDKLARGGARDGEKLLQIRPLWERFISRARAHRDKGLRDPSLERYRWLLEEYRVSVFAQQGRPRQRVSRKRLDALWHDISP